jgi:hypothetical protein
MRVTFESFLYAAETFQLLVERYGKDAPSYPSVTYWRREFHGGREDVEGSPRNERQRDSEIRLRIERALEAFPNESVRTIDASMSHELLTVFYILTQILHLKFRDWRPVPHSPSDPQKVARVEGTKALRVKLLTAKRRNWNLFWTGDE